jgi:hypothetical protein
MPYATPSLPFKPVKGSTMLSIRTLTLPLALAALASCATSPSDGCAGWKPIRMAGETVDYLAAQDSETLKALIAHQEFGRATGCW